MKSIRLLCALGTLAAATALQANASPTDAWFGACKERAETYYRLCSRDRGSDECDARTDRMMENCYLGHRDRQRHEQAGGPFDMQGNMQPIPIPQRPVFVLPGSR